MKWGWAATNPATLWPKNTNVTSTCWYQNISQGRPQTCEKNAEEEGLDLRLEMKFASKIEASISVPQKKKNWSFQNLSTSLLNQKPADLSAAKIRRLLIQKTCWEILEVSRCWPQASRLEILRNVWKKKFFDVAYGVRSANRKKSFCGMSNSERVLKINRTSVKKIKFYKINLINNISITHNLFS